MDSKGEPLVGGPGGQSPLGLACLPQPATWAGLDLSRPAVMGILNVTPDSFSDGGERFDFGRAVAAGVEMAGQGADIVDVGGESTRPGALAVSSDVEQARVVPVIRALAAAGLRVSVDTRSSATMEAALDAGAAIVNDVSALEFDSRALDVVARRRCPVVLMHMRGTPETMKSLAQYDDVALDVRRELSARIDAAIAAGVAPESIAIDPGIGFAKTAAQNFELLRRLSVLADLGHPILVGVSRKHFLGPDVPPRDRLAGSLAAGLDALSRGARILRVHDIPQSVQAIRVWQALQN